MNRLDLLTLRATVLHEISGKTITGVVGGIAATSLTARIAILRRKCRKLYANQPDKLKACLQKANRTKTASNKRSGFK